MRSKAFHFLFVPIILSLFSSALGSGEKIPRRTINGGGTIYSSSTTYKLCGSIAQSMAGKSSGAIGYSYAGFWNPWVVEMTPVEWEEEDLTQIPKEFDLRQNYPNPFNPTTVIQYALPKASQVKIQIYNILGQRVRDLVDERQEPGYKTAEWDGKDDNGTEVSSGIYFYRIVAGDFVKCKKMTLLK